MTMESRAQRKANVISVLNKARSMELQVIHQYMNQHYNLDDMDYGVMAAKIKLIAIDEMQHAEAFAERIKELGGEPTAELSGTIKKGQQVEQVFAADAEAEDGAIDAYNQFLMVCKDNGDSTSMKLFETIIDEEQAHLNYFENVNDHLEKLGATYLAQIAGTSSATGLNTMGFVAREGGAV